MEKKLDVSRETSSFFSLFAFSHGFPLLKQKGLCYNKDIGSCKDKIAERDGSRWERS
jgi:hypothetical protein